MSGSAVSHADALRMLGEPGDVFISGAVYEQARGAVVGSFAAEGTRTLAGDQVSVYLLNPARAARQAEKRDWQRRWEQHQHGWGRHRERHFERNQRRHDRWAEKEDERERRRRAARVPRTPEEKAEYELGNIKRLYRNMVYGGLAILFLFLINVLSADLDVCFVWPALAICLLLALQAVKTLGAEGVAETFGGRLRRWRTWFTERREWAEREIAERMKRADEDERTIRRRVYRMRGFQRRATVFGVIVTVLFVINLMSWDGHWWVVWPMLGLGFALAINAVQVYGIDGLLGPGWEERTRQELRARFEREAQTR
ncbi:MAG: 2TM domain-containing protein [Alphaproteobacteria bacterium]|nr:2TM domain-containing protein [Alphaproteobacteria bacterium]